MPYEHHDPLQRSHPRPLRPSGEGYGLPDDQLLDDAADALERRLFFDRFREGYAKLRADADAWAEVEAERSIESGAVADRSA